MSIHLDQSTEVVKKLANLGVNVGQFSPRTTEWVTPVLKLVSRGGLEPPTP